MKKSEKLRKEIFNPLFRVCRLGFKFPKNIIMERILAFAGSNHANSINKRLLKEALKLIEGYEVDEVELTELDVPMYGLDLEKEKGIPQDISKLREKLDKASVLIIASPEHNSMMPAFLKNILDWLSRTGPKFLAGKKLVLLSTSPGGRGGKGNLENMANVMPHWGAEIVGVLSLGNFNDHFGDNEVSNEAKESLRKALSAL